MSYYTKEKAYNVVVRLKKKVLFPYHIGRVIKVAGYKLLTEIKSMKYE